MGKDDKPYTSTILGGQNPLQMYIAGVKTVSYTHLDVYKRQVTSCPVPLIAGIILPSIVAPSTMSFVTPFCTWAGFLTVMW